MRFGVVVGSSFAAKNILQAGKCAEECGLDYFFCTDHYLTPRSSSTVDAWTILASLAATTNRIRIGTCVTPLTFRPPAQLAKVVATVDQISEGRAILGVGAGWSSSEFVAYSQWEEDVKIRVAKAKEALKLILGLWEAAEPLDFDGKFYNLRGAILEPKPVQMPMVPLWFGTQGHSMLELALRHAEGWLPPVPPISMSNYERVIEFFNKAGKSGQARKKPIMVACNGTLQELKSNKLEQFKEMGCETALMVRSPANTLIEDIKSFSKDVAQSYS